MRDEDEFTRLSQLGDILGLTQMDVYSVHTGLAEQAYRQQVQAVSHLPILSQPDPCVCHVSYLLSCF